LAATLRAATLVLVSLVVALFLAFDPRVYERGVIWLVPGRHEAIAHKTMHRLSRALRWWMLGRLTSMTAVGILTSLGMWAIGMPAPMALGAIAGLLSFVPNIGPIAAAVPGLILAVPLGPWMILGAAGVYLGAQLIESNALNPLIAQYAVSVPPGLLIVTQVILATLGGIWGMVIATPLLVVVMTLVQQLYIREGLKDPIEVTGTKPD
jgi:predicted PurR-regulated permease PerM